MDMEQVGKRAVGFMPQLHLRKGIALGRFRTDFER
jgi:hypothetical protein